MATKRRRQVTYVDDDNIVRISLLKKLGKLTEFFNWTLRNNIDTYMFEQLKKEKGK